MTETTDFRAAQQHRPTVEGARWMVRWRGYAVRIVMNVVRGKVYSLVADNDATRFASETEAAAAIETFNLGPDGKTERV